MAHPTTRSPQTVATTRCMWAAAPIEKKFDRLRNAMQRASSVDNRPLPQRVRSWGRGTPLPEASARRRASGALGDSTDFRHVQAFLEEPANRLMAQVVEPQAGHPRTSS